jgi:succinate-acetate transporter protein
MGMLSRGKTAEQPAIEGGVRDAHPLAGDDTCKIVNNTDAETARHHFHARGRASTPFYVVSQVQSCNMSPLGLWGFGLTTALLQGATTTITEAGTSSLTYCYAIGFGGIAQLLAGMWEARRGKIFGATAFSSYGAFWISFGLFGILSTPGVIEGGTASPIPQGLQMMLCLWGILTFLFFLASLSLNLGLQLLFFLLTITFFLLGRGERNTGVGEVGGWFGIVTAAVAIYIGFAELFNETAQRNVFPLFPCNWLALLFPKLYHGRKPAPYDVARTEARTFQSGGGDGNAGRGTYDEESFGGAPRMHPGPAPGDAHAHV